MVFYCAIIIFPTGSVRLESSKGELDSCTRGSPGSAIAGGLHLRLLVQCEIS